MMHLAAEALSVRLGRNQALAGIDLRLAPGRFTVILGPNGAGKSTLLRALAGLLRPAGGRVTLSGAPVGRMRAAERARAIAYLPQGGDVAWPLPVADVVALGRLPHKASRAVRRRSCPAASGPGCSSPGRLRRKRPCSWPTNPSRPSTRATN
jgi:ABC-type cobalamin/Fe3+-siderophores transport system ATPase subunit